MPGNLNDYDDRAELTSYIWHNYSQLFNETEQLASRTLLAEAKAANCDSEPMRRMLLGKWCHRGLEEVDQLLAEGEIAFRIAAAARVLATHPDEVFVNRCSKCQCIVATPRAKQCLWCGYDWHGVPSLNE
ncbi:MAG: hypothetical protein KF777_10305 [Planctomycetaceae bacterium]|nr:hypothetical protein [Planctomycetaceae bacterium]